MGKQRTPPLVSFLQNQIWHKQLGYASENYISVQDLNWPKFILKVPAL